MNGNLRTGRALKWLMAKEFVQNGRGTVEIKVVREPSRKKRETILKYGLFFRDADGSLWDIMLDSRRSAKAYADVGILLEELEPLFLSMPEIVLPFLREENVFERPALAERGNTTV
jgi:hypothetical protein